MTSRALERKIQAFIENNNYNEYEVRLKDGYFIYLKKIPFEGSIMIDIHTPGFDGMMQTNEAIEWLRWTLYDYEANGLL